jgi:hypothetical protein
MRNGHSQKSGRGAGRHATKGSSQDKSRGNRQKFDSSKGGATQAEPQIEITIFRDEKGFSLRAEELSLVELRDLILQTTAAAKDDLPFLKLATFGTKHSGGGSLRNNENVIRVSGIELDYDAKKMGFAEGAEKFRAMNIKGLIYTTPSYTPTAPKWRLLIPLSKPCLPEMRAQYVAQVHGFFGNIFARKETFNLSQSFYYGKVEGNPDHEAVIIDGDYIDLRDDLYKYQVIGEQEEKTNKEGIHGFEAHLKSMGDPSPPLAGFNGPLTSASSSYARQHGKDLDREELKAKLREAINQAPKGKDRKAAEMKRYLSDKYLDPLIESAIEKFGRGVTVEDFVSYSPQHSYIYKPVREFWVTAGVNANCPPMLVDKNGKQVYVQANVWIDRNHSVAQMTWAPGEPMEIRDKLIKAGSGWIKRQGVVCFNLYLPPDIVHGDASDVAPWLDHVHRVYPDDADHIIKFCAQRVQTPQVKINHALVLGGEQGIGKDTILEPVKRAVGAWNCQEINPRQRHGVFQPVFEISNSARQ